MRGFVAEELLDIVLSTYELRDSAVEGLKNDKTAEARLAFFIGHQRLVTRLADALRRGTEIGVGLPAELSGRTFNEVRQAVDKAIVGTSELLTSLIVTGEGSGIEAVQGTGKSAG